MKAPPPPETGLDELGLEPWQRPKYQSPLAIHPSIYQNDTEVLCSLTCLG